MTWNGEQRAFIVGMAGLFLLGLLLRAFVNYERSTTYSQQSLQREVAKIPKDMTQRVMSTSWSRLRQCLANGGRHLDCIISKN